ncbi:MAG: glycosyltransferase [Pirellulales bacterium]|nr:glycosyltransferase [Pirellulales bacterium]
MERSLSALLPVRDAQCMLSGTVLELLDVLPDLTSRFEIVIIDDASSDATIEVADELAAYYPQVEAIRHAAEKGRLAAISTGVVHSSGEVLFLADADCTVPGDEIRRLWQVIGDHEIVLGRCAQAAPWRWNGRWQSKSEDRGGFCMFHRRAFESIRNHMARLLELRNFLAANRLQWHEVEVRDRTVKRPQGLRKSGQAVAAECTQTTQVGSAAPESNRLRRPNYLERIRQFAVGE